MSHARSQFVYSDDQVGNDEKIAPEEVLPFRGEMRDDLSTLSDSLAEKSRDFVAHTSLSKVGKEELGEAPTAQVAATVGNADAVEMEADFNSIFAESSMLVDLQESYIRSRLANGNEFTMDDMSSVIKGMAAVEQSFKRSSSQISLFKKEGKIDWSEFEEEILDLEQQEQMESTMKNEIVPVPKREPYAHVSSSQTYTMNPSSRVLKFKDFIPTQAPMLNFHTDNVDID